VYRIHSLSNFFCQYLLLFAIRNQQQQPPRFDPAIARIPGSAAVAPGESTASNDLDLHVPESLVL